MLDCHVTPQGIVDLNTPYKNPRPIFIVAFDRSLVGDRCKTTDWLVVLLHDVGGDVIGFGQWSRFMREQILAKKLARLQHLPQRDSLPKLGQRCSRLQLKNVLWS